MPVWARNSSMALVSPWMWTSRSFSCSRAWNSFSAGYSAGGFLSGARSAAGTVVAARARTHQEATKRKRIGEAPRGQRSEVRGPLSEGEDLAPKGRGEEEGY